VEAGEALGFLPGETRTKDRAVFASALRRAARYARAGRDRNGRLRGQTIEVAPLAYMRGRTLNNAFVILDEAQNTTTEQMFMLLTRIGPRSKCVITGDVTQIDLPGKQAFPVWSKRLQALKKRSWNLDCLFQRARRGTP